MIKKSITYKLTLGFLTIVIISTLLIGVIALNTFKNNIYNIKRNNIMKHAASLSQTIEPYLIKDINEKESIDILKIISSFENLKVWVINSNGNVLTLSNNQDTMVTINNESVKDYKTLIQNSLKGGKFSAQIYNTYYSEYMMSAIVPIKNNEKIIGAILVHSSLTDLSKSMNKFFLYLILALTGEILFAGFMSYYFSKSISNPIRKINSSAQLLAHGEYGIKTNIYQKDEIGELSNSFDLLSLKLKYTIEKLSEEKIKLSNIISSMSDGLLALDTNFNIININQSAINLLSYDKSKSNLISIFLQLNLTQYLKSSADCENISQIRKYNDKILSFNISSLIDNGENLGIVILIQDISEKEKLEQMRKDFISNVSHEFRTPLTIMKGYLESITDGMIEPNEINNVCLTLLKETNRLERMVKDLLELSKLESGKIEIQLNEINIISLIKDTIRGLKPLAIKKGIDIKLSLSDNSPSLFSDYDRLKQVLIIFIDNAIKFSPNNGEVKISSFIEDGNLCISIKDSGIGIPKEEIQYLGERFYKADKSRNPSYNGTGLGLSIAKRLLKVLNAEYSIESEINKGTTIKILFKTFSNNNQA